MQLGWRVELAFGVAGRRVEKVLGAAVAGRRHGREQGGDVGEKAEMVEEAEELVLVDNGGDRDQFDGALGADEGFGLKTRLKQATERYREEV